NQIASDLAARVHLARQHVHITVDRAVQFDGEGRADQITLDVSVELKSTAEDKYIVLNYLIRADGAVAALDNFACCGDMQGLQHQNHEQNTHQFQAHESCTPITTL